MGSTAGQIAPDVDIGVAFDEAVALASSGQPDASRARCLALLERDPGRAEIWAHLGGLDEQAGRHDDALLFYERAAQLSARPGPLHTRRGVIHQQRGDHRAALDAYRKALAAGGADAQLLLNLSAVLGHLGAMELARTTLLQALQRDPTVASAQTNLGLILTMQGEVEAGLAPLRRAVALTPGDPEAHDKLLFALNYSDRTTPEKILKAAREFDRAVRKRVGPARPMAVADRAPGRPLRIGFVSADLRNHPVAIFLRPLLAARPPGAEVFLYGDSRREDEQTARLRQHADGWRSIAGLDDATVRDQIAADRVDVLVDLAGHTAPNRLGVFARRAAPVQVSYLGYPSTTGLATMDYRLTDAWADPPGQTEAFHTETLARLPRGFLCYGRDDDDPEVVPAPAGRPVVFGSFNNLAKLSPATLQLWREVLTATADSELLIKTAAFEDRPTLEAFHRRLATLGFPRGRVRLSPPLKQEREHLAAYGEIDIALDPFPYAGTTTTCEALWMGVPVVTLVGRSHASRVGLSLLTQAGLEEWAAASPADYVRIATTLASDPARRDELRQSLRDRLQRSALMDAAGQAEAFFAALRRCWQEIAARR